MVRQGVLDHTGDRPEGQGRMGDWGYCLTLPAASPDCQ